MPILNKKPLIFSNKICRVVCRDDFAFFEKELLDFKHWFLLDGVIIHADRNVLKSFDSVLLVGSDIDIVAKFFKIPNLVSRVIYSFFRPSKAKRSFENSWRLVRAGFSVPLPIAYVEYADRGLLKESFYISERLNFDCTLHAVYRKQMFDWALILPLVVEKAYQMHQAGLMHRDFSHGNILVKQKEEEYLFSFVDLNRLYVGPVSFMQGLRSLVRLANDEASLKILADCYARCANRDEGEAFDILSKELAKHRTYQIRKKNIKTMLGISKKK